MPCARRASLQISQLRFRSTPIIIGNFESCFKQRDESTVNAAVSNHPHNISLSTEIPAKWAYAGFGEGVLTVAIESEAKRQLSPRCPGDGASRARIGRSLKRGFDRTMLRRRHLWHRRLAPRSHRPGHRQPTVRHQEPRSEAEIAAAHRCAHLLRHEAVGRRPWAGNIYGADDGVEVNGPLIAKGSDEMRIRGCLFGICSGQNWMRERSGRRGQSK
jgi:hypothetical protein